jgi:splicing factor 1
MAYRNQGITGSNNIPLGKNRFNRGDEPPAAPVERKRGRSPDRRERCKLLSLIYSPPPYSLTPSIISLRTLSLVFNANHFTVDDDGPPPERKRKSRWGSKEDNKAAGLMGLPVNIQAHMTQEQVDAYIVHVRIEEITQKLKINDVVPNEDDRRYVHFF